MKAPPSGLSRQELLRKLAHLAAFGPVLLLPWLTPGQAMLVAAALVAMNALVLPRVLPVLLRRREPGQGDLDIILYPVAVLACLAAFGRSHPSPTWYIPAATAWFCLAVVDALLGIGYRLAPGPALPWNPRKPLLGAALGILAAAVPAALLAGRFLPALAPRDWAMLGLLLLLAALAESVWFGVADNLVLPFAVTAALPLLPSPLFPAAAEWPAWPAWAVPAAFGLASFAGRLLTAGGAALGALLAFLLMAADPWLFLFLGGFFVLGNAATRFGMKRKEALGIAEARRGRRGAAEVFGAMAAAAWMAPLVHLSRLGAADGTATAGDIHGAALVCIAPLAAKAMDTVSSEVGKAMAGKTISLVTFRAVAPGTEGAVSAAGTCWGLAASALLILPIIPLEWGGMRAAAWLLGIALAANLFESYWKVWAGKRGMDSGPHANVLMTLLAAVLAWACFRP